MDDMVLFGGFFGSFAFVTYWFFASILRWRELGHQTMIMTKLVERVESSGEAVQLLESPAAGALFRRLADHSGLAIQRVLRAIQSGIVLVILGGALFVIRGQYSGEEARTIMVLATLSLAVGLGFLVASGATYALSRRWGLIERS